MFPWCQSWTPQFLHVQKTTSLSWSLTSFIQCTDSWVWAPATLIKNSTFVYHTSLPFISFCGFLYIYLRQSLVGAVVNRCTPISIAPVRVLGSTRARGLRFVYLNWMPRAFSFCEFDFHAKIWSLEWLNISLGEEEWATTSFATDVK